MTTYNIYLPEPLKMTDYELAEFYSKNPGLLEENVNKAVELLKEMAMLQMEQMKNVDYKKVLDDIANSINHSIKLQMESLRNIDYKQALKSTAESIDNLLKIQVEQLKSINYKEIVESSIEKNKERISLLTQIVEPIYTADELEEIEEESYKNIENIVKEIINSERTKEEKEKEINSTLDFLIGESIGLLFFAISNTGLNFQSLFAVFMLLSIFKYILMISTNKDNLWKEKWG